MMVFPMLLLQVDKSGLSVVVGVPVGVRDLEQPINMVSLKLLC